MAAPPRKPSTSCRRAPASLRIPSLSRKASNPALSLVFAQADTHPSPSSLSSISQKSPGDGVSPSEQALSRQLDGDLGGKHMGLRSRRSSSATVRTIRTVNGVNSPSPTESQEEGDKPGNMEAGPSSSSLVPPAAPDIPARGPTVPPLNPRDSRSWKRWNSPAPYFPRSRSKGKGKVYGNDHTNQTADSDTALAAAVPETDLEPSRVISASNSSPSPPFGHASLPAVAPAGVPDPFTSPATPVPGPPARSWWRRRTVDKPPDPSLSLTPSIGVRATQESPSVSAKQSAPAAESIKPLSGAPLSSPPSSIAPPEPSVNPLPHNIIPEIPPTIASPGSATVDPRSGWAGYLRWGAQPAPSFSPGRALSDAVDSASITASNGDARPSCPLLESSTSIPEPAHVISAEAEAGITPRSVSVGWPSYLYSFVSTPAGMAPPPPVDHTTPQVYGTDHPDPIPSVASASAPVIVSADSQEDLPPAALQSNNLSQSNVAVTARKASSASTTGWLTYLAFRASQKKLPTPASVMDSNSPDERSTTDRADEEVMDFSTDPEFPAVPEAVSSGQTSNIPRNDAKRIPPQSHLPTKRSSQALDTRAKRLSISSTWSDGSATPLSMSAQAPSHIDGKATVLLTAKKAAGSALPPPAILPFVQPNLVIPTFSTTFDRPPRSFPPVPAEIDQPYPPESSKGAAASTTALAWQALGAVGNYVYGRQNEAAHPGPSSLHEDDQEVRGRKEGRSVGAQLPRRVGLRGGSPDDGWKAVRRVVVVGVHGWFPAKMLNSVIGEPTGTSQKFANIMGQAVRTFFEEQGVEDLRLTLIPLEGEGTIDGRVDKLFKAYLSNPAWINELRRADAIFFAAHSQGCIVTTHLLSRLIAQGHIRTPLNTEAVSRCAWAFGPVGILPPEVSRRGRPAQPSSGAEGGFQKVAMLAMCGVHLGPLYSVSTSSVIQPYLQWFENAAARELFEFQVTSSAVSQEYQRALGMVLENEVKVVLLASLNDQVVPLYGSSFSAATHPLLLRALFVDGASHSASDFMTDLLCFAFMLRNAGIDDQHLVEHLSEATAGSLTGIGHSAPYEDLACYSLAVRYLFHSTPAAQPLPPLQIEPFSARETRNDFELPWIMRALVDSAEIKDLFPGELKDLREGVSHWKPNTKALKEIKRRLEPMAGRQSRSRGLARSPSTASLGSAGEQMGTSPVPRHMAGVGGLRKDW